MNRKLFWIFALSSSVYFAQGIEGLPSQGLFYYLKETMHFSADKIMFIGSVITLAWLVKPLIGYMIDNSLDKKTWIIIASALSIFTVMALGLMRLPIFVLVSLLVVISSYAAFRDVSVDGIMCQEGKIYNATGKIQSVQWISISISGLITGILGGYIAEKSSYQLGFLFLIPVYCAIILVALFYKESKDALVKTRTTYLFSDLKRLFRDRNLLLVALFIFLYKYSPSFGTPLFFIQRDTFKWGKVWIGTLSSISIFFQITGAVFYYKLSQRINMKRWLYASVFLGAVTTLSYLYYTPVTAVAYDILYGFFGMFIFLMVMDFMARSTLNGMEATSFAFLCSISNLALTASNLSGAFLLPRIGLKWLIAISSLTSFLCLFLIDKIEYRS